MGIPDEAKEWVLDALEDLVRRCGAKTFVSTPILFPSDESFPDVLEEGAVGVRTLIRRKMRYAGLEGLHVKLDVIPDGANLGAGAPIMFAGVRAGEAQFELFEEPGPEELLGFLCFEVAHAYRAARGLDKIGSAYRDTIETDPEVVNRLAAVTTVYLGSGLLAANAAHMSTTHGDFEGGYFSHWVKHKFAGGLPPDIMAWALGVQSVVRNRDEESKLLIAALKPNETAVFKKARKELLPHRETLLARLSLPAESTWPDPQPIDNGPLDEELTTEHVEETRAAEEAIETRAEAELKSRIGYRVAESRGGISGWVITILTALVCALAVSGFGILAIIGAGAISFIAMYFFTIRGGVIHCSEPDCNTKVSDYHAQCPGCGIRLVGEPVSRREVLDLPRYGLSADFDDESIDDSFALAEAHALAEASLHANDEDDFEDEEEEEVEEVGAKERSSS